MADDLLDVAGSEAVVGKTLGSDLAQGKVTLPLIHASNTCTDFSEVTLPELLSQLKQTEAPQNETVINQIIALLKKTGSLEYTRRRADGLSQRACEALSPAHLSDTPARASLISIAQFVVERSW
jgi:octaprenyl-diphosphate synthase